MPKNVVEPSLLDAEVTLRLARIHGMEKMKFFFPLHNFPLDWLIMTIFKP